MHTDIINLSSCDERERESMLLCLFERCPTADNAALFHMKGCSVIVIIMAQGGALSPGKLWCYFLHFDLKQQLPFGKVSKSCLFSLQKHRFFFGGKIFDLL